MNKSSKKVPKAGLWKNLDMVKDQAKRRMSQRGVGKIKKYIQREGVLGTEGREQMMKKGSKDIEFQQNGKNKCMRNKDLDTDSMVASSHDFLVGVIFIIILLLMIDIPYIPILPSEYSHNKQGRRYPKHVSGRTSYM